MSFSRGLKWFIILLLPLTLVWKIAARVSYPNAPTQPGIDARVAEFLMRQHFSVAPLERGLDENPIIRATAGQCRMLVSVSSPVAWDARHASVAVPRLTIASLWSLVGGFTPNSRLG